MSINYSENIDNEIKKLKFVQQLSILMNEIKLNNELFQLVLEKCLYITNSNSGYILTKQENLNILKIESHKGYKKNIENYLEKINEGMIKLVLQDGFPRILDNTNIIPNYIKINEDIQSALLVPINIQNKIQGIIVLESTKKDNYNNEDLELVHTIANQCAQIINRNLLYNDLNTKIKMKDILLEVNQLTEKIYDLKECFEIIMKKMSDKFGIIRGMLVLFDENEPDKLSVFSGFNLSEEEMARGIYKIGEGVIGKVVETSQPICIPDIKKDKTFLNRMMIKRDEIIPISFIAVPLKVEGIIIGVLAIEKYFENHEILNDDKDTLILIANTIASKVKTYQRLLKEKEVLIEENILLRQELNKTYGIDNIIGKSKNMLELFELIRLISDSNSNILIIGENGTGKELIAKSIHLNSSRKNYPFVSVNCSSIPPNLLEFELFGYKKGAFTGAITDKKGKILMANGGTLFLKEINDLPLYIQVKLLKVIQEREIEPIGSDQKIKIDVRIISSTTKNITQLVKEGLFREDLFYRINVVEIRIPPLRERKDDIPLLVFHFIKRFAQRDKKNVESISPEALRILQTYNWPGNVRELENIIERAVLLARGNTIELYNLPSNIIGSTEVLDIQIDKWIESFVKDSKFEGKIYEKLVGFIEKELILKSLKYNKNNKFKTAKFLGINRNTLRTKMKEYGIE